MLCKKRTKLRDDMVDESLYDFSSFALDATYDNLIAWNL